MNFPCATKHQLGKVTVAPGWLSGPLRLDPGSACADVRGDFMSAWRNVKTQRIGSNEGLQFDGRQDATPDLRGWFNPRAGSNPAALTNFHRIYDFHPTVKCQKPVKPVKPKTQETHE